MNAETPTIPHGQPRGPVLPKGLDTPCLVIDLDIAEANARRMAEAMAARGVALRPHIKTHKSVALARLQLAAGAVGLTVGTLGEAEVMADGGCTDIFIAYPLWLSGRKADRLRSLLERPGLKLSLGIDTVAGAQQIARAVGEAADRLQVLVEIDPRYHRTGADPKRAGEVARGARDAGLAVAGIFTHGGHGYAGVAAAARAAEDEVETLQQAAQDLSRMGIEPRVISAGSSPTAMAAARPPINEMRPGVYLLGDRQQVHLGGSPPDGVAVALAATVVSDAVEGQVVLDAGAKSLTKDVPAYLEGHGFLPAYPDTVIGRVSDYHGVVPLPEGARRPEVGEVVAVIPNHACPVVDLFDSFIATRSGEVVGRWPVDARGRSG
ncbi:MAG TPA: alanine racemase [Candidatus Limnocylindrales bacterium]|nr:alanine racemase [Candidatus Limnocylindrales bacterium]